MNIIADKMAEIQHQTKGSEASRNSSRLITNQKVSLFHKGKAVIANLNKKMQDFT